MNIYIDESGSMTNKIYNERDKTFIICLLLTEESEKLKKIYSRFISKYFYDLKASDIDNKMFRKNKFVELKGSSLTPELKKNFIQYFCQNNYFQLLYIKIDNSLIKPNLLKDKANAFNYILKSALEHLYNKGKLNDITWDFNIDERNVKTYSKYELRDYLYTEFAIEKEIVNDISVSYFDSSINKLIQLSDVFSNLLYSNIVTNGGYDSEIEYMEKNNYIISVFNFPPK